MTGGITIVTAVGRASGSKAVAAALACAASEPDRAAVLIDVGGPPPRPTLLASVGARELEERLARHLPDLRGASRGSTCHLAVGGDELTGQRLLALLPLVRESLAVVHLQPGALNAALDADLRPTAILLRADLRRDRALTALAAADLIGRGLKVRVVKRALAWVPARRALFGALSADAPGGLPRRCREGALDVSSNGLSYRG